MWNPQIINESICLHISIVFLNSTHLLFVDSLFFMTNNPLQYIHIHGNHTNLKVVLENFKANSSEKIILSLI